MTTPPTVHEDAIAAILPQTQCTKCGYSSCRAYAQAISKEQAPYNQCPPGGQAGVARLANLLNAPVLPLNTEHGKERPRPVARINEAACIGCTLCIQACPVNAIIGAPKQMHTVLEDWCTGCDLCVAPCPMDCIAMIPVTGEKTGWDAWSAEQAQGALSHYEEKCARTASATEVTSPQTKKTLLETVMARARTTKSGV